MAKAKKVKKAPVRKAAAKSRATAKPRRKKAALRKKPARRKNVASPFARVENAIMSAVSEVDELAVEMGLAGAVPPKKAKRKAR